MTEFAIQQYVYNRVDPTHTTTLRNMFASALNFRFNKLISAIQTTIISNDAFGLNVGHGIAIQQGEITPAGWQAFNFRLSQEKVAAFMKWLDQQVKAGLLSIREYEQVGEAINTAWTNIYIYDSYKRGVIRARQELQKAGFDVPSIEQTGGIEISMSTPFHIDRLGLLYTRVYTDLKGITDQMDALISRVLAQGLADGDNPRLLARKIVSIVNGEGMGELGITDRLGRFIPAARRADMLARTEIIRAHHVATIQEYRNWAIHGVIVQGEWTTAGDDRVCPQCASMNGKVFSLDEIEGMIPAHTYCRCIALPFLVE